MSIDVPSIGWSRRARSGKDPGRAGAEARSESMRQCFTSAGGPPERRTGARGSRMDSQRARGGRRSSAYTMARAANGRPSRRASGERAGDREPRAADCATGSGAAFRTRRGRSTGAAADGTRPSASCFRETGCRRGIEREARRFGSSSCAISAYASRRSRRIGAGRVASGRPPRPCRASQRRSASRARS